MKPVPPNIRTIAAALLVLFLSTRFAAAEVFYVDNRQGSDSFDGGSARPASSRTGPTASISRALELADFGDTIIVARTDVPYYESLSLVGRPHSGFQGLPFTIVGNGAIVDGSRPVKPQAWKPAGRNLWRFVPWRKGFYQLIHDGKPVVEFRPEAAPDSTDDLLAKIPAGQWTAWKGAIYYHATDGQSPALENFRYAHESVGVTLFEAANVQILDLTFRHFRLDGVNAHDRCTAVSLEQVRMVGNGRAGLHVGGSSAVVVRNCEAAGNRMHSALVTELGALKVDESKLDRPPTVPRD